MMLPLTFYAQSVCGLSPTRSALLIAPVAITNGLLAPVVGLIIDKTHPLPLLGFGFSALAISLTWLALELAPGTPVWRLVLPFIVLGVGNAFIWSPLAATATRNLPTEQAGAGSGVYNATRQLGAVLGSAGMAAFMTSRISAEMPGGAGTPVRRTSPCNCRSSCASRSRLRCRSRCCCRRSSRCSGSSPRCSWSARRAWPTQGGGGPTLTTADALGDAEDGPDDGYDDDEYVEYILRLEPDSAQELGTGAARAGKARRPQQGSADDDKTATGGGPDPESAPGRPPDRTNRSALPATVPGRAMGSASVPSPNSARQPEPDESGAPWPSDDPVDPVL